MSQAVKQHVKSTGPTPLKDASHHYFNYSILVFINIFRLALIARKPDIMLMFLNYVFFYIYHSYILFVCYYVMVMLVWPILYQTGLFVAAALGVQLCLVYY